VLLALCAASPAFGRVRQAESVLPPGQSGFVSLTTGASPHLSDQTALFTSFRFKPANFFGTGSLETPRPGVRIVRDAYGVPAVTGTTAADVWFGMGYAVAQDRLAELELFRRQTEGRLAEVLGKDRLDDDLTARRDFYTRGELLAQFRRLPADLQDRFRNYAAGVNAWIAVTRSDPSVRPGEFALLGINPADWQVTDSLAIGASLARTVPSSDGAELDNLRGLRRVGARTFNRLVPLRIRGQVASVPRSAGRFPSQPGRTRADERIGFRRSLRFVRGLPLPAASAARAGRPHGGSKVWAIRERGRRATLFNGPQLGFQMPELFVELELHGPGVDVHGATAPGVPVIASGHNAHVAWGVTSGVSDDDDLYVERLVGKERYRFKGRVRRMKCRDETILVRGQAPVRERMCRTLHGPVQARAGGVAYARRYAIWKRELGTLTGLAAINRARSVREVNRATAKLTWNENLVAADDRGHIGYWHPGLLPLKPKRWDERLPYPGTGKAEWRGFLPVRRRPHVIDPRQGFVFSWNNSASVGWTDGDAEAREKLTGPFHRAAFLRRITSRAHRAGTYTAAKRVDRITGTFAEQRPLAKARLRRARRGATGAAKTVLDTILGWDGNYNRTDAGGTVDPGVAAWQAFLHGAALRALGRNLRRGAMLIGGASKNHQFDVTNAEALALRTLGSRGYRRAAAYAFKTLQRRFGSTDPTRWREARATYPTSSIGIGSFPSIPFFDRGTISLATELGP
jgi:acyl-homoserine lactone acylase PvdQ